MINRRLEKSFRDIFASKDNLASYKAYYIALCNWVIRNEKMFADALKKEEKLQTLLHLNLDDYEMSGAQENGILLTNEEERIGKIDFGKNECLLDVITDTLWDIITVPADIISDCCGQGDMRYVKIHYQEGDSEPGVECAECGRLLDKQGKEVVGIVKECFPAGEKDVKR